jgi:LuxR family maltose regulon positive regulatory protein
VADIITAGVDQRYWVPVLPGALVDRARLTTLLQGIGPGGVGLVHAPPGYGATTAAAAAVCCDPEVRWLGLAGPRTREHVWEQVARWLGHASGTVPDSGPEVFDNAAVIDGLARQGPLWLVLDGVGPQDEWLWPVLLPLAQQLPAQVRLLITSTWRPPHTWLALASRPGGCVLTTDGLALTPDEAMDLLHRWEPEIDLELLESVAREAQGWAAALALAGAHGRQGELAPGWLHGPGADLLFCDWLDGLPAELREFLLETAVLDALSPELVVAVTGRADAADLLLDLDRRHAFLSEVAAPPGYGSMRWWERHPLLTVALRHRHRPDAVQRHSAAAEWFLGVDDLDGSMRHLLASGRVDDAVAYLTRRESGLLSLGMVGKVTAWYDQLAAAQGDAELTSLLRKTWGLALAGDPVGAQSVMGRLEAKLRRSGNGLGQDSTDAGAQWFAGQVALLQAHLAGFRGDPVGMVAAGQRAVAALGGSGAEDSAQLAPILVALGQVFSDHPEAARAGLERVREQPFENDALREGQLAGVTAMVAAAHGEFRDARAIVSGVGRWLERQGLDPVDLLLFPAMLAGSWVHLGLVELDEAETTSRQLLEVAELRQDLSVRTAALVALSRISAARGDNSAALRALGSARTALVETTPRSAMLVGVDAALARVRLDAGDPLRAARIAQSLPAGERRTLLWARIAMRRQPAAAKRALDALSPATVGSTAERHLLMAALHERTSRRLARAHLQRAAELAYANGIGLLLVGAEQSLLDLAAEGAIEAQSDELAWVLERRGRVHGLVAGRPAAANAGPAMSRGELQLIALLPSRASNADLATSLGVSVNTVKTRLRRLYSKLEARDRNEAIRRAQARGLLPPD